MEGDVEGMWLRVMGRLMGNGRGRKWLYLLTLQKGNRNGRDVVMRAM